MIHQNNIRQRTEDMAEQYMRQHGINKYSIPANLLPEYNDHLAIIVIAAQQNIGYQGQSYIDSEALNNEVKKEMQRFVVTMNSIVKSYDLDSNVTEVIQQELVKHGLSPDIIPSHMVSEYHRKGSYITNKLRSNMFADRRDYVRKTEVDKIVHDEMRNFIEQVKDTQSTNFSTADNNGWNWLASLFGTRSINTSASLAPAQIQRYQLDQKVLDAVYALLRTKGIDPDNIPARVVSDYSDAIQKIISRMNNIMATHWRNYVWTNEIETAAREILQPIIDKINYKYEPCSICLDNYKRSDRVGQLSCGHTFHNDCIRAWLENKKTCPLCRATNVIVAKIETVS